MLVPKLDKPAMTEHIPTEAEFFAHIHALTHSITETIDTCILKYRPMLHYKCWWSWEITDRWSQVHRLMRRAYNRRTELLDTVHHKYKPARKGYTMTIENSKKCHWEDFLVSVKISVDCTSLPFG